MCSVTVTSCFKRKSVSVLNRISALGTLRAERGELFIYLFMANAANGFKGLVVRCEFQKPQGLAGQNSTVCEQLNGRKSTAWLEHCVPRAWGGNLYPEWQLCPSVIALSMRSQPHHTHKDFTHTHTQRLFKLHTPSISSLLETLFPYSFKKHTEEK